MNWKVYFQDLSETALQKTERILHNPKHPEFARKFIRVLSRSDQTKEIFTLITKEQFKEAWPRIRREWKRTNEAPDFYAWWEAVYEQLHYKEKGRSVKSAPSTERLAMGEKIRKAREQKGWTQTDLALHAGLKQPYISALEKGMKNITMATNAKLEKILGLVELPESPVKEMETVQGPKSEFQLNGSQGKIYTDLNEMVGLGAGAFFWDACWLQQQSILQSRTHLIGHLFREIESGVREVLRESLDLLKVSDKESNHRVEIEKILKKFGWPESDDLSQVWLELPGKLHAMVHRHHLSLPREFSEAMLLAPKFENLLSGILNEIRGRDLPLKRKVDELLGKTNPSMEDMNDFNDRIPNEHYLHRYFFEKCVNPKWLGLLKAKGIFKHPPEPRNAEEGIQFPYWSYWPESAYLARMATTEPQMVADIILDIGDTQNYYIQSDLVKAVLTMPMEIIITLKDQFVKWAKGEYLLATDMAELTVRLAENGRISEALELAKSVLRPPVDDMGACGDWASLPVKMHTAVYQSVLMKISPVLTELSGIPFFRLLCDILDSVLKYSEIRIGENGEKETSDRWRPEINKSPDARRPDLKNILIDLILNTAEQLMESIEMRILITVLNEKSTPLFKRLMLYLLSRNPGMDPDLVEKYLGDRGLSETDECRTEYDSLLQSGFGVLPPQAQESILGNQDNTENENERAHWQRNLLARFGTALPDKWKALYVELVKKYGEPEKKKERGIRIISAGRGYPSSKNPGELAGLTVEALVQYLNQWQPSGHTFQGTEYGLAQGLRSIAAMNPRLYSREAGQFTQLAAKAAPVYINALIDAFWNVIRNEDTTLEWEPILKLCEWAVKQSCKILSADKPDDVDHDSHWGWAMISVAALLQEGMLKNLVPFKLYRNVWNILLPLTEDKDPTPDRESRNGLDKLSLSINSIRGRAMHAVMQYAYWVYLHITEAQMSGTGEKDIWEEMPGVKEVLEKHSDKTREPSLAIHAIYGKWLPLLLKIDRNWALERQTKLFPRK